MKKTLLISSAVLALASAQAAIPEGGWSVTPAPGATVESITTIVVKKTNEQYMDPYINRSIKINGEAYPVTQKASADGSSITMTLATPVEKPGEYEILVPERTFTYNYNYWLDEEDDNPEMSWTVTVENPDYGVSIPEGLSVSPANRTTVERIKAIEISCAEGTLAAGESTSLSINDVALAMTQQVADDGLKLTLQLDATYSTNGEAHVAIPAGTFTFNGEPSAEMMWYVTVENSGEPEIQEVSIVANPADGATMRSLDKVTLTFEGAATATHIEGAASPVVTSNGTPLEATYTFTAGETPNQVVINIEPAVTTSGEYTLTVPRSLFALTADNGAEFTSDECKLNYVVKAPVAEGEKFVVDKIRYILLSRADMTASVTWPENEADYAALTTVPTSVTYEGETFTVTEIGDLAFSEVHGIEAFTVPEGITRIGDGAFWTSSLSSISIPASVTELGESAFAECQSLTSFTLPATVTTMGEDLLYACVSLKSVTLPEGLTTIPPGFVDGCTLLTELHVPSSVTTIGEFAMAECTALTTTNIPEGVTELGRFAYAYCVALTELPVPESVTTLGNGVFYQSGLTEASLPEAVTVIPDGTFQCCAQLKEFTVGDNVTAIEKDAFYWCFGLEKITFGASVATIGDKAFFGDESIKEVVCRNPVPATGASFTDAVYANALLIVPDGALEAYKAAPGWKEFFNSQTVSVNSLPASELGYSLSGGVLTINAEAPVQLFDAAGRLLYSGESTSFRLPSRGIYVLVSGGKATKLVF